MFLISIDTLRSDRLPVYGYAKGSTPAIDEFRRDAILFKHAFSHSPLTLPSHASIFTGLLPPGHGIRDNAGYVLRDGASTLAAALKREGYGTGAAVSSQVLRGDSGIEAGFDFYDDSMDPSLERRHVGEERGGHDTRAALQGWLAQQTTSRVFGFLHLYEPHTPYQPPAGFKRDHPYNGEVSYADSIVAAFLQDLRQRGLYDDALIVLLSDHGEGLGDHDEDEHGVFLYRESLQVPLLIKLPGSQRANETVDIPVGLDGVAPAILSVARQQPPAGVLAPQPGKIYSETYFPRQHFGWSELFSIIEGTSHYIEAPTDELYDYHRDPAEKNNLAARDRRAASAMRAALAAVDKRFEEPGEIDPEQQRRLAALGYVGSTRATGGIAPDPKEHIGAIRELKQAYLAFERGENRAALARLTRLTTTEPELIDGWLLLARTRARLNDPKASIAAVQQALRRDPDHPDALLLRADALMAEGKHSEARQHAELAIPRDQLAAREVLARIALDQDDLPGAEREINRVLSRAPDRLSALLLAGQILQRQQRFDQALLVLDRAAAIRRDQRQPPIPQLQRRRGEILLELRRVPEAEAALRREIELFPAELEAWGLLAVVLSARGSEGEARRILEEAVKRNPGPDARRMAGETLSVISKKPGAGQ